MKNNNRGFTLIEIVMVLVLLGILAAVAIPNRDFARIIFSGNSPRSTPPRRGFSYATASSSQ